MTSITSLNHNSIPAFRSLLSLCRGFQVFVGMDEQEQSRLAQLFTNLLDDYLLKRREPEERAQDKRDLSPISAKGLADITAEYDRKNKANPWVRLALEEERRNRLLYAVLS